MFGVSSLHYLDDFFVCALSFEDCQSKVNTILKVFRSMGVPVADETLEGPSQCFTFLGIEIDSVCSSIRLPPDKLSHLSNLLGSWVVQKKCIRSEILSLIGSLSFACKVVFCLQSH